MSILYTITAYPPSIGGAQLHLHEFARLINTVHPVGVVYQWDNYRTDWLKGTTLHAPPSHRPEPINNVPAYRMSLDQKQRDALRFWVYAYPFLQSASINRISNTMINNLSAAAQDILRGAPKLIHNSRVGREGITVASQRLAHKLGVPFVFTPNHHHHWKGWFYRDYLRVYRTSDAVIVQTQYEKDELVKLGVDADRLHIMGVGPILANEANPNNFRTRYQIPLEAPMILFLGQKYSYKRFDLLLESAEQIWKQYPQTRFVFIGPRTPFSEEAFESVNDPRIVEIGIVDLQEKTDALAACDILAVPSLMESFGGVYLEAWMFNKPVIVGGAPACREIMAQAEGGFITEDTPDDITRHLLALLGDTKLRQELGSHGRNFAEHYAWSNLTQKMISVYTRLGLTLESPVPVYHNGHGAYQNLEVKP